MTLLIAKILTVTLIVAALVSRMIVSSRRSRQDEFGGRQRDEMSPRARVLVVLALVVGGAVVIALH